MSYNLRIIQEYFQPKIGRKIRIFSLGRKNNILIKIKECIEDNTWLRGDTKFFFSCWKIFHSFAGFSTREENFVSPSGHVMFYLLYLHQWNAKPFHLNIFLLPKGAIYYVPIGGGHWGYPVPQYREKLANTEIPCQKWMKYRILIHYTAVSISRVCLPQACRHQKSNSDIGRKREKTLIGRTIEMPGYGMPFQFRHRLCNHLPLSLKS